MARSSDSLKHDDPLGLRLVYAPDGVLPYLDVVLIHGLGRTSTNTWTQEGSQSSFWPGWLQDEGPLRMARIWTAGYSGIDLRQNVLHKTGHTIDRFVGCLWNGLAKDNVPLEMQIPVIFVAHSTGGIVVKQAYSFETQSSVRSTCAMLFLATPHGTAGIRPSLAWGLEKGGWDADSSLEQAVESLDRINEWFSQTDGDGLHIASFFEQPPAGESIVVDKQSSRLHFPREIVQPIEADHSNISRYSSRNDRRFRSVARRLRQFSLRLGPFKRRVWSLAPREKTGLLHSLLGADGAPHDDLALLYPQQSPDPCAWIELHSQYTDWRKDRSLRPYILCLTGHSGSGKSALASGLVEQLRGQGLFCHFYFFRHDDESKQSITSLFRSLALQMADSVELFRDHLAALAAGGYSLDHDSPESVWKKLFASELSSMLPDDQAPMYWIIDGLDICDSIGIDIFLRGLADSSLSNVPLRVLLSGRTDPALPSAQNRSILRTSLNIDESNGKRETMRLLTRSRLDGADTFLIDQVVHDAQGNFFELDGIIRGISRPSKISSKWRNSDAAERPDPQRYWEDVTSEVCADVRVGDQDKLRRVLTMVAYARLPLTMEQINAAILLHGVTALGRDDLLQLRGDFVQIDKQSHLTMKHRSAWEFLTKTQRHDLCLNRAEGHSMLVSLTLHALIGLSVSSSYDQSQPEPWLEYAITSWGYHLRRSAAYRDGELLSLIEKFLSSPGVIGWIYMLARFDRLNLLADTSATLLVLYQDRRAELTTNALDGILVPWATELTRILGKFGPQLRRCPRTIYDVIPSFCPRSSLVRQRLEDQNPPSRVIVTGVSDEVWDDTLARIPVKNPSKVICSNQHVAVSSTGSDEVKLVSTANPCDSRLLHHEGIVYCMRFSNSGHMLALASVQAITIWQVDIWLRRWNLAVPPSLPILDMAFDEGDVAVLACFKDGSVRQYPLDDLAAESPPLGYVLATDDSGDHHVPSVVAFNQGATLLAVAYRGLPVSVWEVVGVAQGGLRRLYSGRGADGFGGIGDPVRQFTWTPAPYHVLAVCGDAAYIWDPPNSCARRIGSDHSNIISISSAPRCDLLISCHDDGLICVWSSTDLSIIHTIHAEEQVHTVCSDGLRIYGLRSNSCGTWSPACLLPLATNNTWIYTTLSLVDTPIISKIPVSSNRIASDMHPPIEILAVASRTNIHCSVHSRGTLRLFDHDGKVLSSEKASYSATITHAMWSPDGEYLALVDTTRKLSVRRISKSSPWLVTISYTTLGELPDQLLFIKGAEVILMTSELSVTTWSFTAPDNPVQRVTVGGRLWLINHPVESRLVLGVASDGVHVLRWSDSITSVIHVPIQNHPAEATAEFIRQGKAHLTDSRTVDGHRILRALLSSNGKQVLVQMEPTGEGRIEFFILEMSHIDSARQNLGRHVQAFHYSKGVYDSMSQPLGLLNSPLSSATYLAFLDKKGWLCTVENNGAVEAHSFLPLDWLDGDSLEKAYLSENGTLFIPKGDRVGIISDAFYSISACPH